MHFPLTHAFPPAKVLFHAFFSVGYELKMYKYALAAFFTALPRPPSWISGEGMGSDGKEKRRKGEGRGG